MKSSAMAAIRSLANNQSNEMCGDNSSKSHYAKKLLDLLELINPVCILFYFNLNIF